MAAYRGDDKTVELLLGAGADVLLLNRQGQKARDMAESEAVKNLLQDAEDRIICHGFKRAMIQDDDNDEDDDEDEDQQS